MMQQVPGGVSAPAKKLMGVAQRVPERPPSSLALEAILPRRETTREINPKHVQALVESISVLGLIEPVVVDRGNRLLAGGHRLEAIRHLKEQNPKVFSEHFLSGVPVRVMDLDAEVSPVRALEIEVAENEHRKDYTAPQVRELVARLRDAGYRDHVGRPKAGQKAVGPALEVIVGKSMKTIRKMLHEDAEIAPAPRAPVKPLIALLRVFATQRRFVPHSLLEQFDDLVRKIERLSAGDVPRSAVYAIGPDHD